MLSSLVLKTVSRGALGFGAAQIGNLYRAVSDEDAFDTLRTATDAGFTVFDTAPFYGHGLSELRLGQFLRTRPRDSFVISTKVGRYMMVPTGKPTTSVFTAALPFAPVFDYSYDGTMRSIEQSVMRLGLPTLDIVLIHDLDRRNHGADFERQFSIAINGAVKALHALKRSGAVGAIGVAVNEVDVGMRFLKEIEIDCALLAGRYTLLDQSGLDVFLPEAQARASQSCWAACSILAFWRAVPATMHTTTIARRTRLSGTGSGRSIRFVSATAFRSPRWPCDLPRPIPPPPRCWSAPLAPTRSLEPSRRGVGRYRPICGARSHTPS